MNDVISIYIFPYLIPLNKVFQEYFLFTPLEERTHHRNNSDFMETFQKSSSFPFEQLQDVSDVDHVPSPYSNSPLGKQISFNREELISSQTVQQKRLSSQDTKYNTLEVKLESKMSEPDVRREKETFVNNIKKQNSCLQPFRNYQRTIISSIFAKSYPEVTEEASQGKKESIAEVSQVSISEEQSVQSLAQNDKMKSELRVYNQQKMGEKSFKKDVSKEQPQDLLFPDTESMIMNSINSQDESITNVISSAKKVKCSHQTHPKGTQDKQNKEFKDNLFFSHGNELQIRSRSQKKVTFIGDSDPSISEQKTPQKFANKSKQLSFNSIKQSVSSMTSILNLTQHKQPRTLQTSRKIICQDDNHCLFRLMSSKKSDKHLMCRSVEVKDDTTEYKEMKVFLLCKENEHQNIIKMHSYDKVIKGNHKRFIEISMDYYPKNLQQYLMQTKKSQRQINIERKLILFQILKAINFIHSKKIYHRDLNIQNIMMGQNLQVVLSNFAYVKSQASTFSEDNFFDCNFYIRPPELILQPLKAFEAGGDIWSFGCVAVYMVKGEMPFFKGSDAEMILEMIKIMGPPSKEYLQRINFKDKRGFVFPRLYKRTLKQTFQCQDPQLLSFLRPIFVYDPSKRPKASHLLWDAYFDEIRQENIFVGLRRQYNIASLFDFGTGELSEEQKARIVPSWWNGNA